MSSCFSTPISYDTAEIPDNSENVRIGLGGQYYYGMYEEHDVWGGKIYNYYSQDISLRGDVQLGYGLERVFEVGIMGGIAVGDYEYISPSYYKNHGGSELQADIYPYIKFGIPTDPVRFSIKPSLGVGVHLRSYHDGSPAKPMLLPKLDFLVGFGKPELLTLGAVIHPYTPTPVMGVVSLHYSKFTFSFMGGYGFNSEVGALKTFYLGIGKRF